MILQINLKKTQLESEQVDRVKNRLRFALDRFKGVVSKVVVRFEDINGPKGGVDKHCLITVKLRETGVVIVKSEGLSYLSALGNSAGRLQKAIKRKLERRRKKPIRINRRQAIVQKEQPLLERAEDTCSS